MRRDVNKFGFSLIEMVVVVATILILAGALLGVGKYVKVRAEIDLTKSQLEVLITALRQYYTDFDDFPFDTDTDGDGDSFDDITGEFDYKEANMLFDLDDDVTDAFVPSISNGTFLDLYASSAALFYFLDKSPGSRKIAEALMDSLVSNKDADGVAIKLTLSTGDIDLPRFVDAWGVSLRYEYLPDTAFPILTSAGPDGSMDTPDDVTSQ